MPVISMFYGIIILLFLLPPAKLKLILALVEIHKEELMADWKLALESQTVFKIDGLK